MSREPSVETERLLLRRWEDADLEPFAALNADPAVMEHFPAVMTRAETAALIERCEKSFEENGYGMWAVEVAWARKLIGICGLSHRTFDAPFTPAVDVGWRFAKEHWGNGYATEAARAALDFGFRRLGLDQIVSYTVPENARSRRVMERLGMVLDPESEFDHPGLDPPLRHVLYRITAKSWDEKHPESSYA